MFELVIGLEVHIQLNTKTKLFCSCKTSFGDSPNENTCPTCLGLPGSLPVFNKEAAIKAMKFATAVNANINDGSVFERKNYFYPDLPTGYQISQLEIPIVQGGAVIISLSDGSEKEIVLDRAHLETDAGKNIHEKTHSYVDLNRAGTPLLEIVTEPVFSNSEEVTSYLKQLQSIVRYLDISDANMQEGSFRCDVNISIRPQGDKKLYTRAEIKNLNSFKFIEKAIAYEYLRHVEAWEDGDYEEKVKQETRLFDTNNFVTKPMRSKEEAMDYRYFPDPDLTPIYLLPEMYEEGENIPEMPREKEKRYISEYGLKKDDVFRLIQDIDLNNVFELLISKLEIDKHLKGLNTLLTVELSAYINDTKNEIKDFIDLPISLKQILDISLSVGDKEISMSAAKKVMAYLLEEQDIKMRDTYNFEDDLILVSDTLDKLNLRQNSNEDDLLVFVHKVLQEESKMVDEYKAGKERLFGSFIGKVMKATKGQANPKMVNELLKKELGV